VRSASRPTNEHRSAHGAAATRNRRACGRRSCPTATRRSARRTTTRCHGSWSSRIRPRAGCRRTRPTTRSRPRYARRRDRYDAEQQQVLTRLLGSTFIERLKDRLDYTESVFTRINAVLSKQELDLDVMLTAHDEWCAMERPSRASDVAIFATGA
jgi:hypothetical protein